MDNTSNLCYLPGDHLSIFPCNDPEMVSQLLDKLADKESSDIAAQLEYLNSGKYYILKSFSSYLSYCYIASYFIILCD